LKPGTAFSVGENLSFGRASKARIHDYVQLIRPTREAIMRKSLLAAAVVAIAFIVIGPAPDSSALQESGKGTTLFVLTRLAKLPDVTEEAKYEVSRAATFELLMVEIAAGKLDDRNSYLGRYYEHPVKLVGKKAEIGVYAKVQLKAGSTLTNIKPIGDRVVMKYFAGQIGTVNPNPADKKQKTSSDSFYIYQMEAFDPK
jgi:hypothetical protein